MSFDPILYKLDSYDYHLPERLIAQKPVQPRDAARLLVVNRSNGSFEHRIFSELPEILHSQTALVVNNSRVFKARLLGRRLLSDEKLGGEIEFLLLEQLVPLRWEGLFHASVKHKPGVRFVIPTPQGEPLRGVLVEGASSSQYGTVVAEFDRDPISCGAGCVPLPPYIRRSKLNLETPINDVQTYQTVYAKELGSAAAPTAGLHFTNSIIEKLLQRKIAIEEVTLHVGLGTFRPVKEADIRKHPMHEERYEVSAQTANSLNSFKKQNYKITAVGTTAVRTLESACSIDSQLTAGCARTSIFIYPGGKGAQFRFVDQLLTNFHLPKSTLLMLVCAFAGRDLLLAAYEEAIREKYRFYSYGDAMLII